MTTAWAMTSVVVPWQVLANPSGEQVRGGAAEFTRDGSTLTIQQHTHRAIIDWQDFSIGQSELTRFVQPSAGSAVLNRVTSGNPSSLQGQLRANGQVYLINPNGVLVGPDATIHTQSFVAATLDVNNDAFMAGGDLTFIGDAGAGIANRGAIRALGGDVFLIARTVDNTGSIEAAEGTVGLAAGSEVLLKQAGDKRLFVRAGAGFADVGIASSGAIEAAHAQLTAAGGNVYALAINHEGTIRATGVAHEAGRIRLVAEGGDITNRGELIAHGGRIDLDAGEDATLSHHGVIDASAALGEPDAVGGQVNLLGGRVGLFDSAIINASGGGDGGEIYIGGGLQGQDPTRRNAQAVFIGPDATLRADGGASAEPATGDGGSIIIWSDLATRVYGGLSARAGDAGGDGGFVETSGGWIDLNTVPDIAAPAGLGGTWLIDPNNLEIVAGGGNTNVTGTSPFTTSNNNASLGVDLLLAALGSGDVTINTATAGSNSQLGNITWTADLDFNTIGTGKTLTLNAHNDIALNGRIFQSGPADDSLSLLFNADSDSNGGGAIIINNSIATGGGSITFADGVYLKADLDTSTTQLGRSGGDITFQSQALIANAAGIAITTTGDSGDGDILFQSTLDSGNTYALVNDLTRTWNAARTHAASGDGDGIGDTYLATVTSALENSIVTTAAQGNQAWLGGSDAQTEGAWRWVTGPEGLEEGGLGRRFWQGNSGGSAVNGQFENWNAGEPNNAGNEDALQLGFGVAGQWNDLPDNSSALYYIRETNLAPTALTLDAGQTGRVTFNAAVGANKALDSITITNGSLTTAAAADITLLNGFTHSGAGTASLAGDITTTVGDITLNRGVTLAGSITLTAASDVNLNADLSKTDPGSTTLTVRADNDVIVANDVAITASAGTLDVILNGDRDGDNAGTVTLNGGSAINTPGSITLTADALTLAGDITTTDRLTLDTTGAISQTAGSLSAAELLVLSGGDATLTQSTNNAATLAASVGGALAYTDTDDLTIGSLSGTTGLTAAGDLVLTIADDLTVSQAVAAGAGDITFSIGQSNAGGVLTLDANVATTGGFTILGGAGGDTFHLNALVTDLTLDAGAGDDTVNTTLFATAAQSLDGGAHGSGDTLNINRQSATLTSLGSPINADGFATLSYIRFERVNLTPTLRYEVVGNDLVENLPGGDTRNLTDEVHDATDSPPAVEPSPRTYDTIVNDAGTKAWFSYDRGTGRLYGEAQASGWQVGASSFDLFDNKPKPDDEQDLASASVMSEADLRE